MTLSTGVGVRLSTVSFPWFFLLFFLGLALGLLAPSVVACVVGINGDMTGFENIGGPDLVMSNQPPPKPKVALVKGLGAVVKR